MKGLGVLQEKKFQQKVEASCPCWRIMAEWTGQLVCSCKDDFQVFDFAIGELQGCEAEKLRC